jgi:hypothetical protein
MLCDYGLRIVYTSPDIIKVVAFNRILVDEAYGLHWREKKLLKNLGQKLEAIYHFEGLGAD